jgi:hypothetical protein
MKKHSIRCEEHFSVFMLNKFYSQYEFAFTKSSLSTQSRKEQKVLLGKYAWQKGRKKAWEKEPS